METPEKLPMLFMDGPLERAIVTMVFQSLTDDTNLKLVNFGFSILIYSFKI